MPTARSKQISLAETKFYHCISRCVRRAFLCGKDSSTGKSYAHRKQWVEDKILFLAKVFCIDICAYAVMSNHLHIVLYANDELAKKLSDKEVLDRWHQVYKGTLLTQQFIANKELDENQLLTLKETVSIYRKRLFDISWFMRILNESISRRANKEDDCTGHFWEGRFKSQALLDESALLACMAYVDLNPIRANIAKTLDQSDHTSIKKRIKSVKKGDQLKTLMDFRVEAKKSISAELPFDLKSYIQLIETTAECIKGKNELMNENDTILEDLCIDSDNWLTLATEFSIFHGPVGREKVTRRFYEHLKFKRQTTTLQCKKLLG